MTRTLFVQFTLGEWTEEQLREVTELIGEDLPEDVKLAVVPKDLDFMTEEDVQQLIEQLQ